MPEGPYNPKTMNPNEMVSLINTPIVDIPPRLKLLHWAVLSRRFAAPAESEAPIHRNQFSCTGISELVRRVAHAIAGIDGTKPRDRLRFGAHRFRGDP